MEIFISVRGLVEFIERGGDIDNRRASSPENAMLEGGRIHRMIQKRMGSNYEAEVALRYVHDAGAFSIVLEGRADGILTEETGVTVDEIKGTYRELVRIKEAASLHLSQAKCYAYLYAKGKGLSEIRVRLTYCNMDTEEIKYFYESYSFEALEEWFLSLLSRYEKWAKMEFEWKKKRQESIHALTFPFPYRKGQKELASQVYRTIYHGRKLFLEAPTGVGKTISTVFPAIKAVGEKRGEKIFYLTAKTIARTVADEAFRLLKEKGLQWKTVLLTAKDKICFQEETECNPENCSYAKGHYDRINEALFDILTHEVDYSREMVEAYAQKHKVCPFELCLDISLFSDSVICDYNYVFDPHAYLRRFFGEGVKGDYLFLIDEAHNLVDRGREMYSAFLRKEDFLSLRKVVKDVNIPLERRLSACNKELLSLKRECEAYRILEAGIAPFTMALNRLHASLEDFLEDTEGKREYREIRKETLEFYFQVNHFLDIYERVDENYVIYSQMEADGCFIVRLFCVNPSVNLEACMEKARSSILFSATLLPIHYYKGLLGGADTDYEVYAQSAFDNRKRGLYIGDGVTTRYTRRSEMEYYNIARYIYEVVKNRHGNYMIFFPSHLFLRKVYQAYLEHFLEAEIQECILQTERMEEAEREGFLNRFRGNEDCDLESVIHMEVEIEAEKSLLGFCVLGGIFSEGIDLTKDRLIGAIIVGTGIPQVCLEREIIKTYFDERGWNGFDYAYRYPGMNKVLQAAGRVIRTAEDVGIVTLLDERFLGSAYRRLFPREWEEPEVVGVDEIGRRVERFWDEWL